MCRAFVGIKLGDTPENEAHLRSIMMQYMIKSHEKGNREGYFIANHQVDGTYTESKSLELIPVLNDMKTLLPNHVIHGHARKASRGDTTEEYIHGWNYGPWHCSMNGTISFRKGFEMPSGGNDSLHFFNMCFDEKVYTDDITSWAANIKKLYENSVEGGNGVLFFTSATHTIVLSFNKKVTIHFMGGDLLVMNSNDDIHSFYQKEYTIKHEDEKTELVHDFGLLTFNETVTKTQTEKYECPVPSLTDLSTAKEDVIMVFDNSDGKVIFLEDVDPPKSYQAASCASRTSSAGSSTRSKPKHSKKGSATLDELTGKFLNWKEQICLPSGHTSEETDEPEGTTLAMSEDERAEYELYKTFHAPETQEEREIAEAKRALEYPGQFI